MALSGFSTFEPDNKIVGQLDISECLQEGEIVRWIGKPSPFSALVSSFGIGMICAVLWICSIPIIYRGVPIERLIIMESGWLAVFLLSIRVLSWRANYYIFVITSKRLAYKFIGQGRFGPSYFRQNFAKAGNIAPNGMAFYELKDLRSIYVRDGMFGIGEIYFRPYFSFELFSGLTAQATKPTPSNMSTFMVHKTSFRRMITTRNFYIGFFGLSQVNKVASLLNEICGGLSDR